jgi:hypothetical protein
MTTERRNALAQWLRTVPYATISSAWAWGAALGYYVGGDAPLVKIDLNLVGTRHGGWCRGKDPQALAWADYWTGRRGLTADVGGTKTLACALTRDFDALATYNAECARGIVHTSAQDAQMRDAQQAFDAERVIALDGEGFLRTGEHWIKPPPLPDRRHSFGLLSRSIRRPFTPGRAA